MVDVYLFLGDILHYTWTRIITLIYLSIYLSMLRFLFIYLYLIIPISIYLYLSIFLSMFFCTRSLSLFFFFFLFPFLLSYCSVGWSCRRHRLHFYRGLKLPQQVTLKHQIARLQPWRGGKLGVPLHCYCS